jgi:hypothetical protein
VEACFLPPIDAAEGKQPAMIYAHGNGELMEDCAAGLDAFRQRGIGVLLVEYPGYGRSEGLPSEGSIRDTVLAAYDHLASNPDVDKRRIFAFGSSLGGGAVCLLARERPLAALILQSTFTSLRHFSWRYGAPPFLLKDRFDNLAAVRDYAGPVFVAHGRTDRTIPWREGEALAKAAPRGELHLYAFGHGCDLNEIQLFKDLDPFLVKALILPPKPS